MYDFKVGRKYRMSDKEGQTANFEPFSVLCTDGGGLQALEDIVYKDSDQVALKVGTMLWQYSGSPAVELAHICYDITPIHAMLENE